MGSLREKLIKVWHSLEEHRVKHQTVAPEAQVSATRENTPIRRLVPQPERSSRGATAAESQSGDAERLPPGTGAVPAHAEVPPLLAPPSSRLRAGEFKEPEVWVAGGAFIQAPGAGPGRPLTVRIGIDFGTAFTKVVLRAADSSWPVDWSGVHNGGHRLLLPGEFSVRSNGSVRLGQDPSGCEVLSGLKLPFIDGPEPRLDQLDRACVFLALVIQYCRGWFYRNQPPLLRSRRLAWWLTLGVPAETWSYGKTAAFEKVARCAWDLSQEGDGKLNLNAARDLLAGGRTLASALNAVEVVPELAAQVAWYVNSPQCRDGLHLLVDIGAGTLDLAMFNVQTHVDGSRRLPVMANRVRPLGTHFLAQHRLRAVGSTEAPDDMAAIVPTAATDGEFSDRLSSEIYGLVGKTKQKRYPAAPEWKAGVPTFLFGGGTGCPIYTNSIVQAFEELKIPPPRFLPVPIDEGMLLPRTAVAHGLSQGRDSIADVVPPQEVSDIRALAALPRAARADKDELYPK